MSDLVENPEDRFSHNEAHLLLTTPRRYFCCGSLCCFILMSVAVLPSPGVYVGNRKLSDELTSCKQVRVMNTPLHPTYIIVKLGFTGVYFVFSSPEPKAHR